MPSSYVNYSDFGWVAFYDFFQNIGIGIPDSFYKFKDLMFSNQFEIYPYENICFVVKPPKTIVKNEAGQLHNTEGPSVIFNDGYCQYYVNGRNLPGWIWEEKEKITKNSFLSEKNAEIRGGMYAVLGQKKVFELIGATEVVRKFANNETYILYRTTEKIGEKHWQWIGVKCPSTGTDYLLGVPDSVICPIEGAALTWGLKKDEYIINQHT